MMDAVLEKQLKDSLYVHYPMEADEEKLLETKQLKKPVLAERSMWDGSSTACWTTVGLGTAAVQDKILRLSANTREAFWQANENQDGMYSTFGDFTAFLDVSGGDWAAYTQLVFEIRPDCDGLHSPMIRVGFENDGVKKIPDEYSREGFNAISLKNHEWNHCVWDISELPHDRITRVLFRVHKYGKEVSTGDTLNYSIRNIRMQKIGRPNVTKGWICEEGTIVWSTGGYFRDGRKTAIANIEMPQDGIFGVYEEKSGRQVYRGALQELVNERGTFQVLDFSDVETEGRYYIQAGETKTESFPIGEHILESASWKLINFLFCERCGYPVPGKHGGCHYDVTCCHEGKTVVFNGGWHDAADVSQQTTQTAEVADALMELAEKVKDTDRMLYLRLMEEAQWGLDFVLRTSFGEGYRATHALMRRWTDNLIGNFDDVDNVRAHNNAFDNFVISGVEARAAKAFAGLDPELAYKCGEAAAEDYRFAAEVFEKHGIQRPTRAEHTLNASLSQHYAAAALAAAKLWGLKKETRYRADAAEWTDRMLACQDCGEAGIPLTGFFYRDESKKTIVHFNHQSRDHIFAQALTAVYRELPEHEKREIWRQAMERHGRYFKDLMKYSAPYGMIPAGVHCADETEDEVTFLLLHPRLDFEMEKPNYTEQLKSGEWLNSRYCVRHFPVWFSYRGNSAVVLSMAKAASLIGTCLKDRELIEIGREQAYWMLGKNPFGQSMIYGEGTNYAKLYTALCGDTVGQMPVGVETQGNEDVPYWPMGNIATYREIWATSAGHFLWLAADLY